MLARWDRRTDGESQGAVLFAAWVTAMDSLGRGTDLFSVPWSEGDPIGTPRGLRDPIGAVRALEAAAGQVRSRCGSLAVKWGDVFRLRRGTFDLPGNGGAGESLGVFRSIHYAPSPDGRFAAVAGDTFVVGVEFSDPVRAWAVTTYGNASKPGSPHVGDQLDLAARKELRPVWRTREEIEAHLERRESFDAICE